VTTMSGSSAGVCEVAYVLDAAGFFAGLQLSALGKTYTVREVIDEVRDLSSRKNLELGLSAGKVVVEEPRPSSITYIKELAAKLGELGRLSEADIRLLALIRELRNVCREVIVVSDDRSVQNVSLALGVRVQGVKRGALSRARRYVYVCPSCGRVFDRPGTCPVCGVKLIRIRYDKVLRSRA